MLEYVATPVHSRSLAVPHAEHAVVARAGEHVQLLRAPDRGSGEIFIDAGLELHVVRREVFLRAPQRLVQSAERRAAVARDEPGGVETRAQIALALQHRQANQRLRSRKKDPAVLLGVLV